MHPEVERLVLLARTLLLSGTDDDDTGSRAARWWKEQIPHTREVCPGHGRDLLGPRWSRALSHLAPATLR
jgi:hypothetical protein